MNHAKMVVVALTKLTASDALVLLDTLAIRVNQVSYFVKTNQRSGKCSCIPRYTGKCS